MIEDLIARGISAPTFEPTGVVMDRALSLRNLVTAGQLHRQELAANALKLSQLKQAMEDEKAARQIDIDYARQRAGAPQIAQTSENEHLAAYPQQQQPAAEPAMIQRPRGNMADPLADGMERVRQYEAAGLRAQASTLRQQLYADQEKLSGTNRNNATASHSNAQTQQIKGEAVANAIESVLETPPELQPEAYQRALAGLVRDGLMTPAQAQAEAQFPGVESLQQDYARLRSGLDRGKAADARADAKRKADLAVPQLKKAEAEAAKEAILAAQYEKLGMTKEQAAQLARQETASQETARHNRNTEAIAGGHLNVDRQRLRAQQAAMAPPDEAVLDMQADAIHAGVPISQIIRGRGAAADAQLRAIQSRVIQKYPGFQMAQALADYRAQTKSVVDMTGTYNSMVALEGVAGKNLDYALETFAKLPDLKSSILNMPLRLVNGRMLGDGKQAEALAALLGASRETARMVNNFGNKGELTDAARHAVDELSNNPNMTLAQYIGTVKALKTDMYNVKTEYKKGLDAARGTIGNKPAEAAAAAPAAPAPTYKVGDQVMYQGKPHKVIGVKNGKLVLEN